MTRDSKEIKFKNTTSLKTGLSIPSIERFNSLQIYINMWIKSNLNNDQMTRLIFKIRREIKEDIRYLHIPQFRKESIVAISTANPNTNLKKTKTGEYVQYMAVDIVLFTKDMKFDKETVKRLTRPISEAIYEKYFENNPHLEVTRNINKEVRNKKNSDRFRETKQNTRI